MHTMRPANDRRGMRLLPNGRPWAEEGHVQGCQVWPHPASGRDPLAAISRPRIAIRCGKAPISASTVASPEDPPRQRWAPIAHDWPVRGFFDRLRQASRARRSLLCVNLDPDPERIAGGAGGALRHCARVIERTADHVCCYKPNSAFWEQYGADGWKALTELRAIVPDDVPMLLDAKRGDIGSTMRAYARAVFEQVGS